MAKVNEDLRVLRHGSIDRLEPDLKRIVVSQHLPITEDPAATLFRVAAAL